MLKILLTVVIIAGIGWLVQRLARVFSRGSANRAANKQRQWALLERKAGDRYASVAIVPGSIACSAALALDARRMLESEAPALPLPDCDIDQCDCRYRHFDDRRQQERRARGRPEHSLLLGALESDRRDAGDRRQRKNR